MSDEPRLPVEPLSDRRWQEIRKNVLAEAALVSPPLAPAPALPSRAPIYFGALAVALAAAALMVVWTPEVPEPPASSLSRVVTDDSSATATAGDATLGLARQTSVLIIERSRDAWVVSLEHGSAHFDVPPRGERPAFTVEAGRTRVQVIGTAFTVAREPGAPSARVSVDHGAVRVTDGSVDIVLHDGESWPTAAPAPAVVVPVVAPEASASASGSTVTAAPTAAPAGTPAITAAIAAAATVPTSDRDRYREALSREATDPQAALHLYSELAEGSGAWSAPALMSQARLEAELGHRDRARELATAYLAAHPNGINAEDARELVRRLR